MQEITPAQDRALRTARALLDLGHPIEQVLENSLIPPGLRDFVREELERDQNFPLLPARMLVADPDRPDWLRNLDRSTWHYWPMLRQYLLIDKAWTASELRSLDDSSDQILRRLEPPSTEQFDIRGLVLGYVQSGKTANYTALVAKAADAGYRLFIVLSGIDNALRRQTQLRLKRELVGYPDDRGNAVRLPPPGYQWHEFTRDDINGDFDARLFSTAALQAGQPPVLAVMKKHGGRLRQLLHCIDNAPPILRNEVPVLIVDDEADLASIDTRGDYQPEDGPLDPDLEPPSTINGLVRDLVGKFRRHAYVAYTATPFANILIPHNNIHPDVGSDLYPKDFIVDLPKPAGYFGAEEFFGRIDPDSEAEIGGLDIIREVTDEDIMALEHGQLPVSLETALLDFVLAGAARAQRISSDFPATMLIHTSQLIVVQAQLRQLVSDHFTELRDAWRYHRSHGIRDHLRHRWETEFRPLTRNYHPDQEVPFETIETRIGPFIEAVRVCEINSATGEVLDYDREPNLKAIAVGGNKLSRGLTLEGLTTSYFVRRSASYDTLMQMGRWFGFRTGYEDLTRICTTAELEGWFVDLAYVEHQLREDIQVYESHGLTPYQLGMHIWQHPTMQVTSPLKRRFASSTTISQSYSGALQQTFKFPLHRLEDLAVQAEVNRLAVLEFVSHLTDRYPHRIDGKGPIWTDVSVEHVLEFLRHYRVDARVGGISLPLICTYIERLTVLGELTNWTVTVRGRESCDSTLGEATWDLPRGPVFQISRSRIGNTESLGVITSPGDELCGLSEELRQQAEHIVSAAQSNGQAKAINSAAREVRDAVDGLLLLYPISRYSGHDLGEGGVRRPLFDDPHNPNARDLVGLAISFPRSNQPQRVEAYLEGTVGWRPVE